MKHLPILFGYHASDLGNSHIPLSFSSLWNQRGMSTRLYAPSAEPHLRRGWLRTSLGTWSRKVVYRMSPKGLPRASVERLFRDLEFDSPVVYLWAGLSLDVFRAFKANGAKIIVERINCHQALARQRVEDFCRRWRLPSGTNISDQSIAEENEKLHMADAIFCPSPKVTQSLLEQGFSRSKLLPTSYGWSPARFPDLPTCPPTRPCAVKPRFLFVGSLCTRKGIPLLLSAWQRAGLDAELKLVGALSPDIGERFADVLNHPSVTHVPYTTDIAPHYRDADFFVFPSLEEGGPMVTYEAMAHGLLPLVSPMGAGAVVEDRRNGLVVHRESVADWSHALQDLAEDPRGFRELRVAAYHRAKHFTWNKVAQRRADLLRARYPDLWSFSCQAHST